LNAKGKENLKYVNQKQGEQPNHLWQGAIRHNQTSDVSKTSDVFAF